LAYQSFEQLRADRRAYVEAARRNKFEDGLRALLAELYPDNAHFIYELLQNAEDARATTVEFDLAGSRLVVAHDGSRPFTLTDVEAITGIGQSPKKNDETQIGKFGVGFKAVYAYTNHPEIRSGEFALVIRDLFVPEPVLPAAPSGGKTIFTFPFDRDEKRPAIACEEIARGLRELDETTVLFLSSIRTIRYRLPDGASGEVSRSVGRANYISIRHVTADADEETHWLRLTADHAISAKIPRRQTVAAAFKLDRAPGRPGRGKSGKAGPRARVVPLDSARTCIYFPAAKETSGLRFHIHAPFASTVARDSVRDTAENNALVDAIGQLVARELPGMRDDGFIDDGLLESLPNKADALKEPYGLIRDHIREAFWNEAVTPVYSTAAFSRAGFAPAKSLLEGPPELRSVLTAEDLEVLLPLADLDAEGPPQWVAPRDGRAGRFLNGLGIQSFGWPDFETVLEAVGEAQTFDDDDDDELSAMERKKYVTWVRWLESKDDKYLRALYEILGLAVQEDDLLSDSLQDVTLIRAHTESGLKHLHGSGVFFPANHRELGGDRNRLPITLAYFGDDKPSKSKNRLEAFYQAAGVRHWNARSEVEDRLAAYSDLPRRQIDEAQHLADMRLFTAHLAENPADASLFSGPTFLQRSAAQAYQPKWGRPGRTCLDKPYLDTGLAVLAAHTGNPPLSDLYERSGISGVTDFALAIGCSAKLEIQHASVENNPKFDAQWHPWGTRSTDQGIKQDWDIRLLDRILKAKDRGLLRLLWELVSQATPGYRYATFQLNGGSRKHVIDSRLFQRLTGTEWVLDRGGRLREPRAMTVDALPESWAGPADKSLAVELGFGADARRRDAEELEERGVLEKLGMPNDLIDDLLASSDEERQEFYAQFRRRLPGKDEFPSAGSAAPGRRAGLVAADALSAPEYETEMRERRVVKGSAETREITRQYLREQYTAPNGAMYCQACHQQMPFKVRDSWYFVATQFLPERKKQHYQNHLALCPLCAAKYEHVRDTEDTALLAELLELQVGAEAGMVSIAISLNRGRTELKFTGKHAIDLKAALTAAGEER
jgi:hypothetical protein